MSDNKVTNNIKTSLEGRDLIMERIFDGPRDLVLKHFRILSDWLAGGGRVDGNGKSGV
ncbi:hypothetical protein [Peribacillus simplex]|uniref:hypothetical protein n=1 Tax=Peribacillus simplex TaxID=1478 RepID=UPI003D27DB10